MSRLPRRTRPLAALLLAALTTLPLPARAMSGPIAPPAPDALAVAGTDIVPLSSPSLRVTRTADGLLHARVFLAPVGVPTSPSWQARDTTPSVANADGSRSPASSPFGLRLGGSSRAASLAALTNEDGVGLRLALAPAGPGQAAAPDVPGQVADNALTYARAGAGGTDLALAATHEGASVGLTVRDAAADPSTTFALNLDHPVTFLQDPGGAILVRRAVQSCGSTGCITVQQPEYVLAAPVVRQGATGRPVPGAPATLRLAGASAQGTQVTLALDPTWLRASGRAFPLRVDLRLESALSAVRNTTEESVSSCGGAAPAVGGDLVVGAEGGCTYRAFLRFETGSTILRSPIQAASLHLYAPGQAGPAGVQVYAGAPPAKLSFPAPAPTPPVLVPTPPISAPVATVDPVDFREPPRPAYQPYADAEVAAAPGAQGIAAQSGGPWQSWDVTGIAQAWSAQGSAANGGLVLAGQGAPVVFAGSRGAAEADPALAPYLDVTFAPLPAAAPARAAGRAIALAGARPRQIDNPSQTTTVGLAQGIFQPDGTCHQFYAAQLGNPGCMSGGNAATFLEFGYANTVNLSYVRGNSIHFPCNSAFWPSSATWQSVYTYMQNAYNDNLIPIVTFVQDAGCKFDVNNPNTNWQVAMEWFAFLMPQMGSPMFGSNPPMYFEVGNEPDVTNDQYGNPIPGAVANWASFPQWFGEGAGGLNADLTATVPSGYYYVGSTYMYVPGHQSYTNFHILTAGMAAPQVNTTNCAGAAPQQITNLQQAITTAGGYAVPYSRLGVAAHPYSYDVSLNGIPPNIAAQYPYLFPNYYSLGKSYLGPCRDIDQLIVNWDGYFPNLVQFTTEDNYDSAPVQDTGQVATNRSAAYLMDLRTWLWYNLGADGQWGYKNNGVWGERGYPFNLIWFNGIDDIGAGGVPGLLGKTSKQAPSQSVPKTITFYPNCPGAPQFNYQYGASLTTIMANISRAGGGAYSGQIAGEHC